MTVKSYRFKDTPTDQARSTEMLEGIRGRAGYTAYDPPAEIDIINRIGNANARLATENAHWHAEVTRLNQELMILKAAMHPEHFGSHAQYAATVTRLEAANAALLDQERKRTRIATASLLRQLIERHFAKETTRGRTR